VLRLRLEAPAAVAERQPAETSSAHRLRARRRAACHPAGQESSSPSAPGWRRALALPHRDVQAEGSACCLEPASPSVWAWRRVRVIPSAAARRDDRAAVCRGGRPAVHRVCCPEPGLQPAQASSSEMASSSA
jgi:hypothetical protein